MLTAGEAKNVDNAVVLARLFNEASGQKAPSKKHGLFISRPLNKMRSTSSLRVSGFMLTKLWLKKTLRNYFF
ncbi:MAG: hypothetical protein ACI94D_002098 [Neolewinella sp.]